MDRTWERPIVSWGFAFALAACSGGGGGGSGGWNGPPPNAGDALFARPLEVVATEPEHGAIQVPATAAPVVHFDGEVITASLQDQATVLRRVADGVAVPFATEPLNGGASVRFRPSGPLDEHTEYELVLSGLTSSRDGRILDREATLRFRTVDFVPPRIDGASVAAGARDVDRHAPLVVRFDEALDPGSAAGAVRLEDGYGTPLPVEAAVSGALVTVTALIDLPGDRDCVLTIDRGIRDLAGNELTAAWELRYRTAADAVAPQVLAAWPAAAASAMSPLVQPAIRFDESVDPASVETASLRLTDEFGDAIAYDPATSLDQRTLRLVPRAPLASHHRYTVELIGGPGAVTDLSGNPVAGSLSFEFETGTDVAPPRVVGRVPAPGAAGFSVRGRPSIEFDEPLDGAITAAAAALRGPHDAVDVDLELDAAGRRLELRPRVPLAPWTRYTLTIRAGQEGPRDRAGNALAAPVSWDFTTGAATDVLDATVLPAPGAIAVPITAALVIVTSTALDPASVNADSVVVTDRSGRRIAGSLALQRADRVLRFSPDRAWSSATWFDVRVRGGADGLRGRDGATLDDDLTSTFRVGIYSDSTPPRVTATLNGIAATRNADLTTPPHGFTIDVRADDRDTFSVDLSSTQVRLQGGTAPSPDLIFAAATVDHDGLHFRLPADHALEPGSYALTAEVADLSGNVGRSAPLSFRVEEPDLAALPFERVQLVWVRFELDRDGNQRGDFLDDLLRLGLASASDPIGSNDRMLAVLREGVMARAHELFGRWPRGVRRSAESVPIRLTDRRPLGVDPMQIACGGLDPEGPPNRAFGDESTGTLGRAWFDYRNRQYADLDTATSPGLGVFPAELFLFEAKIHQQLYPSYATSFSRRFVALAPAMGGTPAGEHSLDPAVLAPSFDYAAATAAERARFDAVFAAADDWATAIGTILAHEIGHGVGLTARGTNPQGLHGDTSLHNAAPDYTDVMAAAVGYETLIGLDYEFRDLNLAYLRHRILMK